MSCALDNRFFTFNLCQMEVGLKVILSKMNRCFMPKQKDDKPDSLHPLNFEDALKRMLKTPPSESGEAEEKRATDKARD